MIVSFQNSGLIDVRCITTIGVSVKESENPIGFFGTGLKYAIAIILRNGGKVTIWRGMEPLTFALKDITVRDKNMQIVTMNGAELGFTAELGKQWAVWQAFRELWCNAKDEGGIAESGSISPKPDKTTICVDHDEFALCFRNIDKYILQGAPEYAGRNVEYHSSPCNAVFYRCINVGSAHEKPYLFAPNVIDQISLTEDRTIKDVYDVFRSMARAILSCEDTRFLERWLTASRDFAEHTIDLDWPSIQPTQTFLDMVQRLARDTSRPLNVTAVKVMTKHLPEPPVIEADLLESESAAMNEAIEFCRLLKYPVDEFNIIVVESLGEGILGRAHRDARHIHIARYALQLGDMNLASTLIEEWCHIKHGYNDCERDMQNWLFNQITRLGQAYLFERKK